MKNIATTTTIIKRREKNYVELYYMEFMLWIIRGTEQYLSNIHIFHYYYYIVC